MTCATIYNLVTGELDAVYHRMTAEEITNLEISLPPDMGLLVGRRGNKFEERVDITHPDLPFIPLPVAGPDLKIARLVASESIDSAAEEVSAHFATPGSAKAMRYQEKAREAREIVAKLDAGEVVDPTLYPACNTEWPARAASFEDFARLVVERASEWALISGHIEKAQAEGKTAVEQAKTTDEVDAARENAVATLTVLLHPSEI